MASAQVVETSVNTSPSQDYTTNPDDHSNHNIDSPGFKPSTVIGIFTFNQITANLSTQQNCHSLSQLAVLRTALNCMISIHALDSNIDFKSH